jgi:hypothetical protein
MMIKNHSTSPVTNPTTLSISKLRAVLNGRVIAPDDPRYDEARTVFYGGIDRRPAVIVRVADAADVSRVVSLARETGDTSPSIDKGRCLSAGPIRS